ncbi:hypothetical protein HMPREF3206_01100, partial [Fusobacterium equinum]
TSFIFFFCHFHTSSFFILIALKFILKKNHTLAFLSASCSK